MVKGDKSKSIFFMGIAFGLFYFGDIVTTFLILQNGGHELNRYMSAIGFNGYVLFKTILIVVFGIMIYYLDKFKFYRESGIVIGMVLMAGLLATLYNIGFFGLGN